MLGGAPTARAGRSASAGTAARSPPPPPPPPPGVVFVRSRRGRRRALEPSAASSSSSKSNNNSISSSSTTMNNNNSSSAMNNNNGSSTLFSGDAPSAAAARRDLFNSISPVYDELNDRLSFGMHRVWKRMAVNWALRGDGGMEAAAAASSSSSGARRPGAPAAARPPPPRRALDVCCGSGDLALLLADALEAEWARRGSAPSSSSSTPLEVVGLDFAADMLSDAARRERRERRRPLASEAAAAAAAATKQQQQRARIQWVQGDAMRLPFPDASFGAATVGYGLRNVADPQAALRELARVLAPGGHLAVLDFANAKGAGDWLADAAQGVFLERIVVPEAEKYGMREQYAYLRPSVHAYPPGRELERMATEGAGFSYARHYPLAFGMMGCLVATR